MFIIDFSEQCIKSPKDGNEGFILTSSGEVNTDMIGGGQVR